MTGRMGDDSSPTGGLEHPFFIFPWECWDFHHPNSLVVIYIFRFFLASPTGCIPNPGMVNMILQISGTAQGRLSWPLCNTNCFRNDSPTSPIIWCEARWYHGEWDEFLVVVIGITKPHSKQTRRTSKSWMISLEWELRTMDFL